MTDFETWLTANTSPRTASGYLADLRHFAVWFKDTNGKPLTPQALTPTDVRDYIRVYMQVTKRAKAATTNRHLASLRAYSRWAKETRQIRTNPTEGIKPIATPKLAPKWLGRTQQRDLIVAAETALNVAKTEPARIIAQRDLAIVQILIHTGLRVGELCKLELGDIEMSARKGSLAVQSGKGGKNRTVPLNADARTAIQKWLEIRGTQPGVLLSSRRSDGMTGSAIHRRLKELGQVGGIEISAHTLRHTFAKNLLDSGTPLDQVAALLGHSDVNITKIYTAPSELDLEKAVNRISITE